MVHCSCLFLLSTAIKNKTKQHGVTAALPTNWGIINAKLLTAVYVTFYRYCYANKLYINGIMLPVVPESLDGPYTVRWS